MLAKVFIENLLKKAGVTVDPANEKFKLFIDNPELAKLDIPDEVTTSVDNNIISIAAAKDNYGPLKNFYHAQALNGMDAQIEQLIEELGLGEDDKNEFKVEKSTGKKINLLLKKAQALESKKANADKPDKVAIQKTIDDLNKQILTERSKGEQLVLEAKNEVKKMKLEYLLSGELGKHKTIFDESLSPELRNVTLRNAVQLRLAQKGAKLEFDESGNPTLLRADGTKYFGESNEAVDFPTFVAQTLSTDKLLAVNKPPATPGQNTPGKAPGTDNTRLNGNTRVAGEKVLAGQTSAFQELMKDAQKDFKNVNGVVHD